MSEIAEAIGGTVADMFGGADDTQTEDTVEVAAQVAEVAPDSGDSQEDGSWDFEAAGRDLFADDPEEAPDFDALAEAELGVEEQDELAPTDYDDDQTRQLKKQLLAERKKSEYHARRHLETARRSWEQDVKSQPWAEFLPKDLSTVKASSHREFIRAAKATAKQNYELLKPHYERIAAREASLRTSVTEEARQEAQSAWGRPTVGTSRVPTEVDRPSQDAKENALRSRNMFGVVKAMIDNNEV